MQMMLFSNDNFSLTVVALTDISSYCLIYNLAIKIK